MKIDLLSLADQQRFVIEQGNLAAIKQLEKNAQAPEIDSVLEVDESQLSSAHLLRENQGWIAPDPDLVAAYFRHFQAHFPVYGTDKKLAGLLGLSSDRRVRDFKSGARKVPYDLWRRFLVMTGRVDQEVIEVLCVVPVMSGVL